MYKGLRAQQEVIIELVRQQYQQDAALEALGSLNRDNSVGSRDSIGTSKIGGG